VHEDRAHVVVPVDAELEDEPGGLEGDDDLHLVGEGEPVRRLPSLAGRDHGADVGEASALVVSDTRLLGRSVDLAAVLRRLDDAEAALVAVDLGLDTTTAQGRRVASALVTVSGWGRQRAVATAAGERKAPEKWVGRLTLEPTKSAVVASTVNGVNGHNGTDEHALSGVNGVTVDSTNGHIVHTDEEPESHNGTTIAATYQNGHMVIAKEKEAVTRPDEEALAS